MTSPIKRNGPGATPGAVSPSHTSSREDHHQDTDRAPIPHLLIVKTPAERVMRRTYLSLPAAEKAVRRAQERGSAVTLELHRVVPYTVGAELHGAGGVL